MMQQFLATKSGSTDNLSSTKLDTTNGQNFQKESTIIRPVNTSKAFLTESENDIKLAGYDQIQ